MLPVTRKTIQILTCTAVLHFVFILFTGISPIQAVTVTVLKKLRQFHVIPDVIDVAPTSLVQIRYPNHVVVKVSDILPLSATTEKPIAIWPAASDGIYTLIMTNPDWPSPLAPNRTEFLHWLVVNINGSVVSQAETKVDYLGPLPTSEKGIHRYVFTAFRQKSLEKFNETFLSTKDIDQRTNFSTLGFVEKYEFGYPVAVNFYRVDFNTET